MSSRFIVVILFPVPICVVLSIVPAVKRILICAVIVFYIIECVMVIANAIVIDIVVVVDRVVLCRAALL